MTGYDKDNDKFYCKCESEMKLVFPTNEGKNVYHCSDCGTVAVYHGVKNDTIWHLCKE